MITSPEDGYGGRGEKTKKNKEEDIYRLFLVGQKGLPEIVEGKSSSKRKKLGFKHSYHFKFRRCCPGYIRMDGPAPARLQLVKSSTGFGVSIPIENTKSRLPV